MSLTDRLTRLERAAQWYTAVDLIDRLAAWSVATGRCTAEQAADLRAEQITNPTLETYISGSWEAPPRGPNGDAGIDAMLAKANAWEQEQGLQPPRPPLTRD